MRPADRSLIARLVLDLLDRDFANQSLCLKGVSEAVGRTECEISRLLVAATGRGFREHVRHRRVEHAKKLLTDDALSLKEIAGYAGFGSASQFTRQFRGVVAITPSQYRRLLRRRRAS